MSKRKLHRNPSEPNELKAMALAGESFSPTGEFFFVVVSHL